MGSLTRVLVANRGEIATRIIRTLQRMGVESVAVYSDADRYAPHVAAADKAVHLGASQAGASYLDAERIVEAARETGADGVHPGYGFLSENAAFARACEDAGIAWIGPTPEQLEQFGRKDAARALARAAGVPLLPGSDALADLDAAIESARVIGYPVMLKSRAGGGGIGMQRCDSEAELVDAFERVSRLAAASFGDGACFVERFVARARHVEVQLFGDGRGDVLALGTRDCSAQRRNQKVVEECPAAGFRPETTAGLIEAALALGRAVAYRSAGTVEFVVDADTEEFAFLEVNTRLQVEHPVTEAVYGVDLVAWMVRLAAGAFPPLPDLASILEPRGVAIEARVYAEDPAQDFRPAAGTITQWLPPTRARVDGWIETGTEVTPYYDPLLAKVIVHGADRSDAIGRLDAALAETRLAGITSNLDLLRAIVCDEGFRSASFTTASIADMHTERRAVDVLAPGAQTTVQEWPGRLGYWDVGVPPSGPMDDLSFRIVNRLAGNEQGAAALECTMMGPTLRFACDTTFALGGAVMEADLDGVPVPWWEPVPVAAGQVLTLGRVTGAGARTYVAWRGGIEVPPYLGSRATFVLGRFGGHAGRALDPGDVLPMARAAAGSPVASEVVPELEAPWRVRVLPGPHAAPDFFTEADIAMLYATEWEVHHHSDRTGVRLIGPAPQWARTDGGEAGLHPSNIHDNEYAVGTIDFTGDMPIILGPDGPSLGGFVCPATVAAVDLWKLGQLQAGERVVFVPITHERAVDLLEQRAAAFGEPAARPMRGPKHPVPDGAVLYSDPPRPDMPALAIRRAGDRYVLIELGENRLDLDLRVRVHALHDALADEFGGLVELAPGIRSLQVRYDPLVIPIDELVRRIVDREAALPPAHELTIPSRIVHLPLAWNDSQTQLAIERYARTVRADAPWCPSNLEFIRRINGLDSIEDVRRIVFDASYLVLGLGDVYLGAPVATPLDPRHRLVTTKYNPARTWTPENAVGIGGAYLCVYGMEGPGGYQFVGRTVPVWNRWRTPRGFEPEHPWLLRFFDQLRFFPVSEAELLDRRADMEHGHGGVEIEAATIDLAAYHAFLAEHATGIEEFRTRREAAFAEERARWAAAGVPEHVEAQFAAVADEEDDLAPGAVPVSSPVPGAVGKVLVAPGDAVAAGDPVVIVEAMKTEVPVNAPAGGAVTHVRCEAGAMVRAGQTLMVLQP
ncbi:MAG TPA: urea carboxylase [Acidimicrobiia bacterium]|nr:urea carboxylase [Acidimicrobiia bacterium]